MDMFDILELDGYLLMSTFCVLVHYVCFSYGIIVQWIHVGLGCATSQPILSTCAF